MGNKLFSTMTINQFVLIGCGIIVTVTGISISISKSTNDSLIDSATWIAHSYSVKAQLKELETMLIDAETGQRGYIITNTERYLAPYNQAKSELRNTFLDLKKKISDNSEQLNKLDEVENLSQQKINELAESITLKKNNREKELLALLLSGKGKKIMDDIRQKLDEMNQVEDKLLQERQKKEQEIETLAIAVYWGNLLCVTVVTIAISFAIILIPSRALSRSLEAAFNLAQQVAVGNLTTQVEVTSNDVIGKLMATLKNMMHSLNSLICQVQKSGIEVTSSSTQIAASGKQLEAMMTEQVASIREVSASAREISITSKELLKTMEEVSARSQVTTIAANNSQKDLVRMEATMHQLASATNSIAALLGVMNEKANNINNIVVTITKVANQTNLLSLNAAIEAEKAGESGLGFAVVAREIRRLADQTSVATLSIEQMVKQMQSSVSTGVMEMDKFTKEVGRSMEHIASMSIQMGQIIQQVQNLTPRFETVNQGMETQSQGAQQISDAMVQLSGTSTQTADSLREINNAIVQLNQVTQELRQEILRFKVNADRISSPSLIHTHY